jgi:hypothetical protein
MLAMSFVASWAAFHFWRAGRTVRADLEEVGRLSHLSDEVSTQQRIRKVVYHTNAVE